jgi:hypothetical protein
MAVPLRTQAEAIARLAAIVLVLVVLLVAGCGDDTTTRSTAEPSGTSTTETAEKAPDLGKESRPSRRDTEVQRNLKRQLRQDAAVADGAWTFADVEDVQVRDTQVAIQTRLSPRRRDAAASLCLAVRRFFLKEGQGQTVFDVVVAGRARETLGRC